MLLVICDFYTAAGPNLIQADALDSGRLDGIHQHDISEFRKASDTKLRVSGAALLR